MKERVKIPALVSLSREIERSLGANQDLPVLREKARHAGDLTRRILRGRGLEAGDLSPASRQALDFLERFSVTEKRSPNALTAGVNTLALAASKTKSRSDRVLAIFDRWKNADTEDEGGHDLVGAALSEIRDLLEGRGKAVDLLRREAFHAYCTLEFLSEPAVFSKYLEKKKFIREWAALRGMKETDFAVACGPYLYFARPERKKWFGWFQKKNPEEEGRFRIHPYLLALPDSHWSAVLAALRGEMMRRGERKLLRGVTRHPLVTEARRYLESRVDFRRSLPWKTVGEFHDLEKCFERVNGIYFQGTQRPAWLGWTSRPSLRRLGFYDPAGDRIAISKSLDHPSVPDYVVEYILYHETLHKFLGVDAGAGRRRIHDKTFLDLERKFEKARESEAFLKRDWRRIASR